MHDLSICVGACVYVQGVLLFHMFSRMLGADISLPTGSLLCPPTSAALLLVTWVPFYLPAHTTVCKVMAVWCKNGRLMAPPAGEEVEGMLDTGRRWSSHLVMGMGRGREANSRNLVAEQHQLSTPARGCCPHAGRLCHTCCSRRGTCHCCGPWRLCWPKTGMMSCTDDPASPL